MKLLTISSVLLLLGIMTGCNYFGPCIDGTGSLITEAREVMDFSGVTNTGSFDVYVYHGEDFQVEVKAQGNLLPIIETYVSGYSLIVKTKDGTCFRSSYPVEVYVWMPETEGLTLSGSGKIIAESARTAVFECINSGSGHLVIDTIDAHDVTAGNSGSGLVRIGETTAADIGIYQSGSGTIDGGTVYGSVQLKIRHSSSGRVRANIVDGTSVDAVLSGSGKIELSGESPLASYTLNSSGRLDALEMRAEDVEATNTGSGNIYLYATEFLDAVITGSGNIIYRGQPRVNVNITGSGSLRPY
ncbi:MAG: head GIN domain-containing protein [Bacteroidales bacterium]